MPLTEQLARQHSSGTTRLIGINGCQGSGKSTLASLLALLLSTYHGKKVAILSIDDCYLTLAERTELAKNVHLLMLTRGVPGTHDVGLLADTLSCLRQSGKCTIPRFNKATDDRKPKEQWDNIQSPVDIVLLEGWCVGVTPQNEKQLAMPINQLERVEDKHCIWRSFVNNSIESYQQACSSIDTLIMLKAPNFDCVSQWRGMQERKLALDSKGRGVMDTRTLDRFIQHFERITEHMLQTLPERVDHLFLLNDQQQVVDYVAS